MALMRNIVLGIAFAVAIMLPGVSYAQFDAASLARNQRNGQGVNQGMGFGANQGVPGQSDMIGRDGQEGMEGEVADSVLWILGQALIYTASVLGIGMYFNNQMVKFRADTKRYIDREIREDKEEV